MRWPAPHQRSPATASHLRSRLLQRPLGPFPSNVLTARLDWPWLTTPLASSQAHSFSPSIERSPGLFPWVFAWVLVRRGSEHGANPGVNRGCHFPHLRFAPFNQFNPVLPFPSTSRLSPPVALRPRLRPSTAAHLSDGFIERRCPSSSGLTPPTPTPWPLPWAGRSPTMSLARRRRPSWSVCLSPRAACSLAMILGKHSRRRFPRFHGCPPSTRPVGSRVRTPPSRRDAAAVRLPTTTALTNNELTRDTTVANDGGGTNFDRAYGRNHGYFGRIQG